MEPAVYNQLTQCLWQAWKKMEFTPSLSDFAQHGIGLNSKEADLVVAYTANPNHSKEKMRLGIIGEKTRERELATLKSLRERLQQAAPAHPYTALIERELLTAHP